MIDIKFINDIDKYKVFALLKLVKTHSKETYIHMLDVAERSLYMGKLLGLEEDKLKTLYTGALLHDIGKIVVKTDILHKPGQTEEDVDLIRNEHIKGTKLIIDGYFSQDIINLCYRHHERMDGSGYPCGLRDYQLDISDKIIHVADTVSAMLLHRSYRDGVYTYEDVKDKLDELVQDGKLDVVVVSAMKQELAEEEYVKVAGEDMFVDDQTQIVKKIVDIEKASGADKDKKIVTQSQGSQEE